MEKPRLQPSSFLVREQSLLAAAAEEGVTMMGDNEGEFYRLDAVGKRIWILLEQPCSVSFVCEMLQAEFDVDPETCERDVVAFLEQLCEKGIVRVVPEPPSATPS